MTQLVFGSGSVWAINSASNPTPARFNVAQEVSVDFNAKSVPIFGQNQLPFSVARGSVQTQGKITFGQLNGRVINEIFWGGSAAGGQIQAVDNEAGTVPGSSTYTISVANNATWTTDLGVIYAATGIPLTRVASGPSAGQYSVAAGVYTFASGDASTAMKISYLWTTTGGQTFTISNQAMGQANTFKTVISLPYAGQKSTITLNACVASKLTMQTKLEDFAKPTLDFDAFADSSGTLGTISVAELS